MVFILVALPLVRSLFWFTLSSFLESGTLFGLLSEGGGDETAEEDGSDGTKRNRRSDSFAF